VHVRGHGIAEQQQLDDRRGEHDPLRLRVAEDLAQLLPRTSAAIRQPCPRSIISRDPLVERERRQADADRREEDHGQALHPQRVEPTPFRKTPRVTAM
jgi:hypothetical protein